MLYSDVDCRMYIGGSRNIKHRVHGHLSGLRLGKHENTVLQKFADEHGVAAIKYAVLEECPVEQLVEREQYYLDIMEPLFNQCPLSDSQRGAKRTPETVERIRISQLGKKCPGVSEANRRRRGVKHTEDAKAKIGKANRGRPRPALAELNRSRRGKPLSPKHRANVSRGSRQAWERRKLQGEN